MQRNIPLSYSVELGLLSKLLDGLPLNGDLATRNDRAPSLISGSWSQCPSETGATTPCSASLVFVLILPSNIPGKGGYFNDGLAASGFVSHIDQVRSGRTRCIDDIASISGPH